MSIIDVTFQMNVGSEFFDKVSFKKILNSKDNEEVLDSEIESSTRCIYPRLDFGRVNMKIPVHIKYINSFTNYKTTIIECKCKLRSVFQIHISIGFIIGLVFSIISSNIYVAIFPISFALLLFIWFKNGVEKQVIKAIRKFESRDSTITTS